MTANVPDRQAWIKTQVNELIALGDDPREAEEFVRTALALVPPWADPATDLPSPAAVSGAAVLDEPSLFDARVEWYTADFISPRFKRLLDARVRLGEYDPSQPRAPEGSDIGGQWIPAEGGIRAAGTQVSSLVRLNKYLTGDKDTAIAVREALSAIDQVHGITGPTVSIPMKSNSDSSLMGAYTYKDDDGMPKSLQISTKTDTPGLTATHEIGHFVDHADLGSFGEYSAETLESLSAWREAAFASPTVRNLQNRATKTYTDISGRERTSTDPFMSYLASTREVFARSYAQYVAIRSGNPTLVSELHRVQNMESRFGKITQWDDDEFAPIAEAFDNLFAEEGMRT